MSAEHKELLEQLDPDHENGWATTYGGRFLLVRVGKLPLIRSLIQEGLEVDPLRATLVEQDTTLDRMRQELTAAQERERVMRDALKRVRTGIKAHERSGDTTTSETRWVKIPADLMLGDIDEALTSQPAAPAGETGGWLPIESAPKGKKLIASYVNPYGNRRMVMARYYEKDTLELADYIGEGYAPEGWYEESETHEEILTLECAPTHWQPLPPAPAAEQPDGAPYCQYCGAKERQFCKCGPIAKNH